MGMDCAGLCEIGSEAKYLLIVTCGIGRYREMVIVSKAEPDNMFALGRHRRFDLVSAIQQIVPKALL